MSKIALVLGATGLVGAELVQQLAASASYQQVVAFTRRPLDFEHDKVVNRVLDFQRLEDFADWFQGDVMFSCLGTTKQQAGSISAQRKVDLDYQLQAASFAAANGLEHFLLVSSSGANEQSFSPYLKMKGQLEQQLKSLGFPRLSIFQPSLLTGQRQQARFAEKLGAKLLQGLSVLPGVGQYRPIPGAEVAGKMLAVSLSPGQGLQFFRLRQVFLNGDDLSSAK